MPLSLSLSLSLLCLTAQSSTLLPWTRPRPAIIENYNRELYTQKRQATCLGAKVCLFCARA